MKYFQQLRGKPRLFFLLFLLFPFLPSTYGAETPSDLILWYNTDAQDSFTSAIPIGNGFMGGMIYGNAAKDKIGLNEGTIWSDSPGENNKEGAFQYLAQARAQIFAGNYSGADETVNKMIGGSTARFLPAGNLYIEFSGHTASNYYRELDLRTAISKTTYTYSGVTYTREYFASYPDKVIIVRLTANQSGKLSFSTYLDSPFSGTTQSTTGNNLLILNAKADAIKYQTRLLVQTDGGTVNAASNKISVSGANSATLLLTIATNYNSYNNVSGDPAARATEAMSSASAKTYDALLKNHLADYQALFNRVDLSLGSETTKESTTDKRVSQFNTSNDPGLVRLYYQFGRYLMISCSREGSQPANLQGIWNKDMYPSWGSKYTTNINLEMNYWMTESANLAECAKPFIEKVKSLVPQGEITAKEHWGVSEGWVLHHNTDLWNRTAPIDGQWGFWPTGGGWLSTQLWEHYKFAPDSAYLADVYPTIKGAAQFFLNSMVEETVSGHKYLVTVPSASPELQHGAYWTCFAPTMDIQIVRDVFNQTIKASEVLGTDSDLRTKLAAALAKLPPHQIGKYGQLQEWFYDWDSPTNTHRHVSHLYGLFPSNQISPRNTADLAAAAKVTLTERGDEATGWSLAWKINFWARLDDGDHAYKLIKLLLTPDRTYNNLFDAHPPFQIDGNFGAVSGINEMLVQSQNGEIELLPALPSTWSSGYIKGIRARGNFVIDSMAWGSGKLTYIHITSLNGNELHLRYGNTTDTVSTSKNSSYDFDGSLNAIHQNTVATNIPGKIEAEDYLEMSGIQKEPDSAAGINIGFINSGDWSAYLLNVKAAGNYTIQVRTATAAEENGFITIENRAGDTLGTITVKANKSEGWHDWYIDSTEIQLPDGEQTLTFKYSGTSSFLFNIDWIDIEKKEAIGSIKITGHKNLGYTLQYSETSSDQLVLQISIPKESKATCTLYDLQGISLYQKEISKSGELNFANLKTGIYLAVLSSGNKIRAMQRIVIK
ncbi:MAG: glycoside hydrolase N-terminal domain-containing protein [Fibrobacteraceae bacterium]|nr:glycoside hydrolase N-terminal domain-containing protein [Fibrobacteraceae bacterium]